MNGWMKYENALNPTRYTVRDMPEWKRDQNDDRRTMQFLEEVERKLARGKTELRELGKVLLYEETAHVS
jgi:hypothetical protein